MAKASHLPESKIAIDSGAKGEDRASKVFVRSEYPKTVKENIKLFLNLFINFLR